MTCYGVAHYFQGSTKCTSFSEPNQIECHGIMECNILHNIYNNESKSAKYTSFIWPGYSITPVAIDSFTPVPLGRGHCLFEGAGLQGEAMYREVRERAYLLQHLSIAMQRENTASV